MSLKEVYKPNDVKESHPIIQVNKISVRVKTKLLHDNCVRGVAAEASDALKRKGFLCLVMDFIPFSIFCRTNDLTIGKNVHSSEAKRVG